MTDETVRDPGASPTPDGNRDYSTSSEDNAPGSGNSSAGSGPNDRNRRRPKSAAEQRVRWVGIASAVATVVFLLAQMYGTVTGNKELSEKIQDSIPTEQQIEDLGDAIGDVQTSVDDIPPATETTIIQKGEPGQPGQPGQPGAIKIVRTAPNTVVVTTAAPVPPIKSNSQPAVKPTSTSTPKACTTSLFGTCIIP